MIETSDSSIWGIDRGEFRRGFFGIIPLWFGVIPFAFAYSLVATTSGLSAVETLALSLFVFAGSAQLAFANLAGEHAGALVILATVLLLNLRHILYGLSLNDYLPVHPCPQRPILAYFMTDESYGFTIRDYRDGRGSPGFLFGASVSLFLSFAIATVAGVSAGRLIPSPERLGLDFVFPLSFMALLLPLLRKRLDLLVAAVAGASAFGLSREFSGGITILISTMLAASMGAGVRAIGRRQR
jgi:predicted branched-subunit amino acid permease